MKTYLIIFVILCVIVSATLIIGPSFENQSEKEVIELVQQTKMELSGLKGLLGQTEMTWGEFAKKEAAEDPTKTYTWRVKQVDEAIFLVDFCDQNRWGRSWEANMKSKVVRNINASRYLSFKYGLSRLDQSGLFRVTDIVLDTLMYRNEKLIYKLKASVLNYSGKNITDVSVENSEINILFEEKDIIEKPLSWNCEIIGRVSENNPWKDGGKIKFSILIEDIKTVYLHYKPVAVFFLLELEAKDPIGFNYNRAIHEIDLSERWKVIQQKIK